MKRYLLLSMLLPALLMLGSLVPASAQSGVDPQLLSFVQGAFTSTNGATSFNIDINAVTTNGVTGQTTVQRQSSYQFANYGSGWSVAGTQSVTPVTGASASATPEASSATPEATAAVNPNTTTLELVIVNGKTYIRYTAIPVRMEVQNPPPTWTDLSTLPPGTTFGGGIPTAQQILAVLALPINATSVTSLSEQPPDTINGESMRVFKITLDTQAVLNDADAVSVLNVGGGGPRPAGASATQPASAPAATPAATPQAMTPANTQFSMTVWIGSDNLISRVTSVVTRTMMGANGQGTTLLTTTTDFSSFNQPVSIGAPALGT